MFKKLTVFTLLGLSLLFAGYCFLTADAATYNEFPVGKIRTEGAINSSGVKVLSEDGNLDITQASGTSVPSDGSSGYAKGCVFYDTDVATGLSGFYVNLGTNTSCKFRVAGSQAVSVVSATAIGTGAGATKNYIIAPMSGRLSGVRFSGSQGCNSTANNYITFTIVNKGQGGSGSTDMLHGSATTKPGDLGTVTANAVMSLTLTSTLTDRDVTIGDRLELVSTVTGTLSAQVTNPTYLLTFGGP